MVFSDVYQLDPEQRVLQRFAEAFPEIELEWLDAEGEDVLELVGSGRRAGLLPRQESYRMVWWHGRWPITANCRCMWRATCAGRRRPSRSFPAGTVPAGAIERGGRPCAAVTGLAWTATDYLMVMEMAEDGIGWAELPRALVQRHDRGSNWWN